MSILTLALVYAGNTFGLRSRWDRLRFRSGRDRFRLRCRRNWLRIRSRCWRLWFRLRYVNKITVIDFKHSVNQVLAAD